MLLSSSAVRMALTKKWPKAAAAVGFFCGLAAVFACETSSPTEPQSGPSTSASTSEAAGATSQASGGNSRVDQALLTYLVSEFDYVAHLDGFFIAGTNKPSMAPVPSGAEGQAVFDDAVDLFSRFVDRDADGVVDHPPLVDALASKLVFVIGYDEELKGIENRIESEHGRYAMAMKTDIWPYVPSYKAEGLIVVGLRSSLWRPDGYNALWEETFHTVTEAYNRHDPSWGFQQASFLGKAMQSDMDAKNYDTAEQNRLENGAYDFQTAVNEYVHQIWAIHAAGQAQVLTPPQKSVLDLMKQTPGFPLGAPSAYEGQLATRVK